MPKLQVSFPVQIVIVIVLLMGAMVLSHAGAPANTVPPFSHIFVIVLENREANSILDSPDAPYLTSLAPRYAVAAARIVELMPRTSLTNWRNTARAGKPTSRDFPGIASQAPGPTDMRKNTTRSCTTPVSRRTQSAAPGRCR